MKTIDDMNIVNIKEQIKNRVLYYAKLGRACFIGDLTNKLAVEIGAKSANAYATRVLSVASKMYDYQGQYTATPSIEKILNSL